MKNAKTSEIFRLQVREYRIYRSVVSHQQSFHMRSPLVGAITSMVLFYGRHSMRARSRNTR